MSRETPTIACRAIFVIPSQLPGITFAVVQVLLEAHSTPIEKEIPERHYRLRSEYVRTTLVWLVAVWGVEESRAIRRRHHRHSPGQATRSHSAFPKCTHAYSTRNTRIGPPLDRIYVSANESDVRSRLRRDESRRNLPPQRFPPSSKSRFFSRRKISSTHRIARRRREFRTTIVRDSSSRTEKIKTRSKSANTGSLLKSPWTREEEEEEEEREEVIKRASLEFLLPLALRRGTANASSK